MDLELDADELALRDQARALLTETCPPSLVRRVFDGADDGSELWGRLVEQGWTAVNAPTSVGGLGLGAVAEAVLAGEVGRAVAPVPYLATVTQFGALLTEAGTRGDAAWTGLVDGAAGALAIAEAGGCRPVAIDTTATGDQDGWRLDGVKVAVLSGSDASHLAVVARRAGTSGAHGLGAFLVDPRGPGCTVTATESIDPTTPLAQVTFEDVRVDPADVLLDPNDAESSCAIERVRRHATVMLAISCVATCRALFETTVDYTKTREQFGRPIGGFQAVKHRLADLYLAVERADALCWYAVTCVAEGNDEAPGAVAMAKAAAGECRRLVTRDALQLHGAIGFTWEHDLHLGLKRATVTAALLGDVEAQRAELAALLGLVGDIGRDDEAVA